MLELFLSIHVALTQILTCDNLVPRAHVHFGQHQDTELWNNKFSETKILGLPASRRMRGLVYMASRDEVNVEIYIPQRHSIRSGKARKVEIWL